MWSLRSYLGQEKQEGLAEAPLAPPQGQRPLSCHPSSRIPGVQPGRAPEFQAQPPPIRNPAAARLDPLEPSADGGPLGCLAEWPRPHLRVLHVRDMEQTRLQVATFQAAISVRTLCLDVTPTLTLFLQTVTTPVQNLPRINHRDLSTRHRVSHAGLHQPQALPGSPP